MMCNMLFSPLRIRGLQPEREREVPHGRQLQRRHAVLLPLQVRIRIDEGIFGVGDQGGPSWGKTLASHLLYV